MRAKTIRCRAVEQPGSMAADYAQFGSNMFPTDEEMEQFEHETALTAACLPEGSEMVDFENVGDASLLALLAHGKGLRDGECYVISIVSGPFNRVSQKPSWPRPRTFIAQVRQQFCNFAPCLQCNATC